MSQGAHAAWFLIFTVPIAALAAPADAAIEVGFGKVDITPTAIAQKPVWIAGYGHNRKATGVHDPLYARAVVLKDSRTKIALVSVDLVGFMYPNTKSVRRQLPGFDYVLVASTHNHEGPDTIGLWGRTELESGVDPEYLAQAERGVVEAVRLAEQGRVPATAEYGTAADESLVHDTRLPIVKDGVLRAVRFSRRGGGPAVGLVVQWNCHPENLGSRNTLITADFPFYAVKTLEAKYGCPVAYFSGAVGGLMTGPEGLLKAADGTAPRRGDYEFSRLYGEAVAALASVALALAEPIELAPFAVSARPIGIPLANPLYRAGRTAGVLAREGFSWTGDPDRLGPLVTARLAAGELALETEVAYLRLGELHVAAIPGELYPELVYGHFQDPPDPNADWPDAPLEPPVMKTLPGPKTLLLGLANDEVGYIIPKRQWDDRPPFAYGRKSQQYGEVNSVGPETAPILLEALKKRVQEVNKAPRAAVSPSRAEGASRADSGKR